MTYSMTLVARMACVAAVATLVACASSMERAEELALQEQWTQALIEYRKIYNKDPGNIAHKSRLKQAELKAADFYYQRGARLLERGDIDGAIVEFQQGLVAMPEHSKLLQSMNEAVLRKEANATYKEALALQEAGKEEDGRRQLERVLEIYPGHKEAGEILAGIKRREEKELLEKLVLASRAPITLNFRQTDLKTAFEFIGKSFGVNIIFDDSIKSVPVTLFVKDVTFEQALQLMMATTKTFYKEISANTILVAQDTKEKRGQYEDNLMRTFYLNSIKAKEMADILKGVLTIKKLIINEQNNSVVIRDTEDVLKLVEKVVVNNDRKPAEVWLEVEILEVSRTKTEQLGLNFGQQIMVEYKTQPQLAHSWRDAIRSGTVTLPPTILQLFKKDVDAKILANPKVRTVNAKAAKIHIGDRVPLRAATIQDATGQIRTTYQYTDVGIKLTVEPNVHLDNSATVKVTLEVSSLGQNLGTATEPAFSIGTRNAESIMVLRDGETAILGGLISDEDRKNRVRVPGLGDIPVLGALFTNFDNDTKRTDVLLTITPRVIRGWDIPTKAMREFYSGTETLYLDKPIFAKLSGPIQVKPAAVRAEDTAVANDAARPTNVEPPSVASAAPPASAPPTATPQTAPAAGVVALAFSEGVYETTADQEQEIRLTVSGLSGVKTMPIEILFNPQLLTFVRGESGDVPTNNFNAAADATRGVIRVDVALDPASGKTEGTLAKLRMRATKPGISYLVYRVPTLKNEAGESVTTQVRASRMVVK